MKPTYPADAPDAGINSYYLWCQLFGCCNVAVGQLMTSQGAFDVCYKHNTVAVFFLLEEHGARVRDSITHGDTSVMKLSGNLRAPLMINRIPNVTEQHIERLYKNSRRSWR